MYVSSELENLDTDQFPVQQLPETGQRPHRVSNTMIVAGAMILIALIFAAAIAGPALWKQAKVESLLSSETTTVSPYTATESASPTAAPPVAPTPVATVPVGVPTSLVIRRGADEVLRADHIGQMEATAYIKPKGFDPKWLSNLGIGVGTEMKSAWFAGHDIVGTDADPFGLLGNVQPGDIVEIGTAGGMVYFTVNPGKGDQPSDGVWTRPKSGGNIDLTNYPGVLKLVSCSDDGSANIIVTASLIK